MHKGEQVIMSGKTLNVLEVIQAIEHKTLTQKAGAARLGLTVRHTRRLQQRYRSQGAAGLVSKRIGRRGNHRHRKELKDTVLTLIKGHYADFGPTLACEYLQTHHAITVSKETLRQWMSEAGLWQIKKEKRRGHHPSRARRPRRGELVQIDGSPHAWFEERGPSCTLLVFIDDATSELLYLQFVAHETTLDYMAGVRQHLTTSGRPWSYYSDKHSIFRVNTGEAQGCEGATQLGRALSALHIELIWADSPQAKGRVERANGVLQDRLVKALRLAGVNDMAAGNAYLPGYMKAHNERFAVVARDPSEGHRSMEGYTGLLDKVLSLQHERTLSKGLSFRYKGTRYQVCVPGRGYRLQNTVITVCESGSGVLRVYYKEQELTYQVVDADKHRWASTVDGKSINRRVEKAIERCERRGHKPCASHPWRSGFTQQGASSGVKA